MSDNQTTQPWWFRKERPELSWADQQRAMDEAMALLDEWHREQRSVEEAENSLAEAVRYDTSSRPSQRRRLTNLVRKKGQWWVEYDLAGTKMSAPLATRHEHIARIKQDEMESMLVAQAQTTE
jgi:hypothetical protein